MSNIVNLCILLLFFYMVGIMSKRLSTHWNTVLDRLNNLNAIN